MAKLENLALRLSSNLMEALKHRAARRGVSASEMARTIISEHLSARVRVVAEDRAVLLTERVE